MQINIDILKIEKNENNLIIFLTDLPSEVWQT